MGGFDLGFQKELARSSWSLYSVGMLVIGLRMFARIHRVGIRGLAPDDYMMLLAGGFYTALIICLNVIARGGGSNLFELDELSTFTQEEIGERVKGSKIVLVSEQAMLNVIYTLKVCLLIMYSRITTGLQQQLAVKILGGYVAIGWLATELAYFFACRPFSGYWAVPPPDPQCTTFQHYAIVQACFNISSDLLMLCIPLPLLIKVGLPLKQKIVLIIIFSMGAFVIVAAILTKVFNLSDVYSTSYMLWYTREASVAVYVANLPLIWPLLRELFPKLRSFTPGYTKSSRSRRPRGSSKLNDLSELKSRTTPSRAQLLDDIDSGKRRGLSSVTTTTVSGRTDSVAAPQRSQPSRFHIGSRRDHSPDGDKPILSHDWPRIPHEITFKVIEESYDLEKASSTTRDKNRTESYPQTVVGRTVTIEGGEQVAVTGPESGVGCSYNRTL